MTLNKLNLSTSISFAVLLSLIPNAEALTAISSISGGSTFLSPNGTNQTIGWRFSANSDLSVSSLGFYDNTPANDLAQTHQVGLWDSSGNLLASTTILTNSSINDSFRYETITPIALIAGQTYYIGGAVTSPFSDFYRVPATLTVDPAITLLGSARNATSGGFSFPSTVTTGNGRFGPNFEFTVTTTTTTTTDVPFEFSPLIGLSTLGVLWGCNRLTKKVKISA